MHTACILDMFYLDIELILGDASFGHETMSEIVKNAPRPHELSKQDLEEAISQLEEARSKKQNTVLVNQRAMDTHRGKALTNIELEVRQRLQCTYLF